MFSSQPLHRKDTQRVIQHIKDGKYLFADELVTRDPYIVFDFDIVFMTPLHWACKKGDAKIAEILIAKCASLDAQDILGRRPLFFAIQSGDYRVCEVTTN